MAESPTIFETLAETQVPVVEASIANNTAEDTQARDSHIETATSQCVHYDHPNDLHGSLESELLHKTKLLERLERVVIEKNEVIESLKSLAQELEDQLSQEKRETTELNQEYEQQRVHSNLLYQSLLREHEGVLSLRNQMTESEISTAALTEELHEKTVTIQKLEKQLSHARAIVNEITSRMRNVRNGAPSQCQEDLAGERLSQQPDNHENRAAYSSRAIHTSHDTPTAARAQPTGSTPEPPSSSDSANDPALTILISCFPTWIRSCFKPAEPREADGHKIQQPSESSSPESKASSARQTSNRRQTDTKKHLKFSMVSDETAEQSVKSASFLALRNKQQQEEQQWSRQGMQPMTKRSTEGVPKTHENDEALL